jgi:hypothetical protein
MSNGRQVQRVQLGHREMVFIDDARNQQLHCDAGELWITHEGDSRDFVLQAGQSWQATVRGPVVVSALKPSVVTLTHLQAGKAAAVPKRRGAESALDRIRRWRFPPLASLPIPRLY